MKFDLLTLFPSMLEGVFSASIIHRAQEKGLVDLKITNFRDFATDKHSSVDDKPYGGGPGMVLSCEPIFRAVESVLNEGERADEIILMSPQGEPLTQQLAADLATKKRLVVIAGHYEGFDERIRRHLATKEISIGDYVLTGGELPAMVLADAIIRLLPGVLGHQESHIEESFSDKNLLEYPQYTRPVTYRGHEVPEVLLSGNHENIRLWRQEQALENTKAKRPDLRPDIIDKKR